MEDTKTTAILETTTPSADETALGDAGQETLERKSIDIGRDEYQLRVDRMLAEHKAKESGDEPPPPETLREGESWDSIYSKQPPEVQRAMAEMRKMTTQKTQELAAQRKEIEAAQRSIQSQQLALQDNQAYRAIKEQAEADAGEFDPYDPKSFQRYVEKQVAQRLQSILEPMAQQQMKQSAQQKVQGFMSEHPELKTDTELKNQVRETLLGNESLTLQDAYWIVKGRISGAAQNRQEQEAVAFKQASKRAGLKVGGGQNKGATIPTNSASMKAHDLYSHLLSQRK